MGSGGHYVGAAGTKVNDGRASPEPSNTRPCPCPRPARPAGTRSLDKDYCVWSDEKGPVCWGSGSFSMSSLITWSSCHNLSSSPLQVSSCGSAPHLTNLLCFVCYLRKKFWLLLYFIIFNFSLLCRCACGLLSTSVSTTQTDGEASAYQAVLDEKLLNLLGSCLSQWERSI